MSRPTDTAERVVVMEELVEEVCWHLLAGSRLARIGFVSAGEPFVLPFNFAMRDKALVFRTTKGSMLHALGDGAAVAVEVDNSDPAAQTGWSVVVRGRVWEITDRQEIATYADGAVQPWAPGAKEGWMIVLPHAISGRAITRRLPANWQPPVVPIRSRDPA